MPAEQIQAEGRSEDRFRVRTTGLAWRETAGEIVVLDLDASAYFGLNPTAAHLWSALVTGTTRAALASQLAASGASEPERDADAFLAELASAGLLIDPVDVGTPAPINSSSAKTAE